MIKDQEEAATKRALIVMIELYRKRIWNDENTVNVISEACLHKKPKIVIAACKFFLVQQFEDENESDSSDEEDDKSKLLNAHNGSKLTRKKKNNLKKALKTM